MTRSVQNTTAAHCEEREVRIDEMMRRETRVVSSGKPTETPVVERGSSASRNAPARPFQIRKRINQK